MQTAFNSPLWYNNSRKKIYIYKIYLKMKTFKLLLYAVASTYLGNIIIKLK